MIDTAQLEKLTEDCKQISEAIGIMSLDRGAIGIYSCGCPIKCSPDNKAYMDDLPFADKLTGIANEVRDLIKRRLTEAMQAKAKEISALCNPQPSMRDVHAVMLQTDPDQVAELGSLIPPLDDNPAHYPRGTIIGVPLNERYRPGRVPPSEDFLLRIGFQPAENSVPGKLFILPLPGDRKIAVRVFDDGTKPECVAFRPAGGGRYDGEVTRSQLEFLVFAMVWPEDTPGEIENEST